MHSLRCDLSAEGEYERRRLGLNDRAQIEASGQVLAMPLASVTIDGVTHNLMRHPELYNMKHINDWIDDYNYTEHYKVPVKYEKRSPLWIQARRVYEYYFNGAKEWLAKQ